MNQLTQNRILVIGADSHFCYLMRRYVRESDHDLLFSSPDEGAIKLAENEKPALIVMEAGPQAVFNQTILQQLKGNQTTSCIPVVVCSWNEEDHAFSDAGVDVNLRMPILYGDFLSVLSNLGI